MTKPYLAMGFSRKSGALILAAVCLAYVLAISFVFDIAKIQDQKSLDQTTKFIRFLVQEKKDWLRRTALDHADWGTAYDKLHRTVDRAWAFEQDNVGPSLLKNFSIEYAAVIAANGAEVYSLSDGAIATRSLTEKLPLVRNLVDQARRKGAREAVTTTLAMDGAAVLLAASVISPGGDASPYAIESAPSVLVLGDRISDGELAQIRENLGLQKLRLMPVIGAAPSMMPTVLEANDGAVRFILDVTAPQPGTEMLHGIVPSVALVGGIFAIILVLLARQGLREASSIHKAAAALEESHRLLQQTALYDSLTGLPNRALFTQRLDETLRTSRVPVSVLFLDLDRFKPINDEYGHEAGDFVLREVGRRLKSAINPEDLCARLGGDEFVVFTFVTDEAKLHRLCKNIIRSLSQGMSYGGRILSVGASIGIAQSRPGIDDLEDVLRRSDQALYEAKSNGRLNYRWFHDQLSSERASA